MIKCIPIRHEWRTSSFRHFFESNRLECSWSTQRRVGWVAFCILKLYLHISNLITFDYLVVEDFQCHRGIFCEESTMDEWYFRNQWGKFTRVDIFLEDHHVVEVEFFFPINFNLSEVRVINDLIEGVLGMESTFKGRFIRIAHILV